MEILFQLVPLIVFLPVVGLLINMAFGGKMGEKAIGVVASSASGLAFVVSVLLGIALWTGGGESQVIPFAEWIRIGQLDIPWNFRVDTLSVTMMLVVSITRTNNPTNKLTTRIRTASRKRRSHDSPIWSIVKRCWAWTCGQSFW